MSRSNSSSSLRQTTSIVQAFGGGVYDQVPDARELAAHLVVLPVHHRERLVNVPQRGIRVS